MLYNENTTMAELCRGSPNETPEQRDQRSEAIFNKFTAGIQNLDSQENALPFGPLAKNQATMDFEYIVESLCKVGSDVSFTYVNGGYIAKVKDREFDFSKTLKDMDGRQIKLSEQAMEFYASLNAGVRLPDHSHSEENKTKYSDLHESEKKAIYNYTGEAYTALNGLLRGATPEDIGYNVGTSENLNSLKYSEFLLQSAMALSGLNSIPDTHVKQAFRGEDLDKTRRSQRQTSIDNPSEVVVERGFISTTADGLAWKHKECVTRYTDLIGKDISGLTAFPFEREFLIPPTQMKYMASITEKNDQGKEVTYYMAKPVNTTAGLSVEQQKVGVTEEQRQQRIQDINSLLESVKNIRSEYEKLPSESKTSFLRNHQIKSLIKSADKLINDKSLTPDQKLESISKKLDSIQRIIKIETKVKSFFGLDTDKSRLKKVIEGIKNKDLKNDEAPSKNKPR